MSDSVLHDSPMEFFQENFLNVGFCDAQSILPTDEGYACHCTCGRWDVVAATTEEGLALAEEHTMPVTQKELAKRAAEVEAEAS